MSRTISLRLAGDARAVLDSVLAGAPEYTQAAIVGWAIERGMTWDVETEAHYRDAETGSDYAATLARIATETPLDAAPETRSVRILEATWARLADIAAATGEPIAGVADWALRRGLLMESRDVRIQRAALQLARLDGPTT